MSTKTFPFSTLINKQTSVFPALGDADVILQRRDAEDLVLMRDERYRAMTEGLRLAARSLKLVVKANRGLAEDVFAEELPWLKWLPAEERPRAVNELLDDLLAGADTGLFLPLARNLIAWKHTAEAWSDPGVAHDLQRPIDPAEGVELTQPAQDAE
jgi:hypothetical protein